MEIKPVGFVVEENVIEIKPEYEKAMIGLKEGMKIWVLYEFHKAEEKLLVHPHGDKDILKGAFATRSPCRPNRIGLTAVEIKKIDGRRLIVDGLDALVGSPVVDIKPYAEVYDSFGSVLSYEEIKRRIIYDKLIEDYIDLDVQLQPNGFDCTLRAVAKIKGSAKIDFHSKELPEVEMLEFDSDGWIHLKKGFYKAYLNEIVNLPNDLMALARPRSTLIRSGANVLTAVWDAGYRGRSEVGLVVYNEDGIWLKKNARIVQLVFIKLSEKTKGYSGSYQMENITEDSR
jgi:dUTP pyrophosphatase